MEAQKLAKAEELAETPEGKKALVNEDGKAYLVQESTNIVWDSFNKKTVADFAQELADASGRNHDEFEEPIQGLANEPRVSASSRPCERPGSPLTPRQGVPKA